MSTYRQDIDPTLIEVVGCSSPQPREATPADTVTLNATVTNPNDTAVSFDVNWSAVDLPNAPVIARRSFQISPQSTTDYQATFVPGDLPLVEFEPPWASNVRATVVPGSIGGTFAPRQPAVAEQHRGGCGLCGHANAIRARSSLCGGLTVLTADGERPKQGSPFNLLILGIGSAALLEHFDVTDFF